MATYRSRTHRTAQTMSWADWRIAIGMAFPFALGIALVLLVVVFG